MSEGKSAATPQMLKSADDYLDSRMDDYCGTCPKCIAARDSLISTFVEAGVGSVAAPKAQPFENAAQLAEVWLENGWDFAGLAPAIRAMGHDAGENPRAGAPKAGEPPQGEEDGCDDCQYWQAQLRASEAARQITVGQLAESESKLRGAGETPAERIEEWPLCDYTRRPSLDKTQMCRCDSCQHFADVIRKLAPLPLPPGAGSTKDSNG